MPFLTYYRRVFNLMFVFGICPFVINRANTKVKLTRLSCAYGIVNLISVPVALVVLGYYRLMTLRFFSSASVLSIVLWGMNIIIILLYLATLITFVIGCQQHMSIINNIQSIKDKIFYELQITETHSKSYYKWLFVKHLLSIIIFGGLSILMTYVNEPTINVHSQLFTYVFCWSVTTISLAVMHVRDIGDILVLSFSTLIQYGTILIEFNQNSREQFKINRVIAIMIELCIIVDSLNTCFGILLLMNEVKDFILCTSVSFFILTQISQKLTWTSLSFILVYFMPLILKNTLLASSLHRLGEQVRIQVHTIFIECLIYTSSLVHLWVLSTNRI